MDQPRGSASAQPGGIDRDRRRDGRIIKSAHALELPEACGRTELAELLSGGRAHATEELLTRAGDFDKAYASAGTANARSEPVEKPAPDRALRIEGEMSEVFAATASDMSSSHSRSRCATNAELPNGNRPSSRSTTRWL